MLPVVLRALADLRGAGKQLEGGGGLKRTRKKGLLSLPCQVRRYLPKQIGW